MMAEKAIIRPQGSEENDDKSQIQIGKWWQTVRMMTKLKSRCESDDSDLLASLRRWEEEQEEKESLKKKITSEIIKKEPYHIRKYQPPHELQQYAEFCHHIVLARRFQKISWHNL